MSDHNISSSPFIAVDSSGKQQKIKFITANGLAPEETQLVGYAVVDATGSLHDLQSSSLVALNDVSASFSTVTQTLIDSYSLQEDMALNISNLDATLLDVSSSLININSITEDILSVNNDLSQSVSSISKNTDEISSYSEQTLRFNRATHIYSKNFNKDNLYDSSAGKNPVAIDLHVQPELNPAAINSTYALENYISKAIEVFIQNSTNKNVFLKVSYNPAVDVSAADYTIKIQPGIIYNSESKIAHMRHKICMQNDTYDDLVGEICTSIMYNTNLNHNLSVGATFTGQAIVTSIITNFFVIPFSEDLSAGIKTLVSEWNFTNTSGFDSFKITGQARISSPGQKLKIYVTNTITNEILNDLYVEITSTTPTTFDLAYPSLYDLTSTSLVTDNYELIVEGLGEGEIGDGRILFADLIKYVS